MRTRMRRRRRRRRRVSGFQRLMPHRAFEKGYQSRNDLCAQACREQDLDEAIHRLPDLGQEHHLCAFPFGL